MRLGIGNRTHLPCIKEDGIAFSPFSLLAIVRIKWAWNRRGLLMDGATLHGLVEEWSEWERYYLPPFPLEGKTVLDVGACCGDTAYFYLKHGAKKVICIENNPDRIMKLIHNAKSMNIEVVPRSFDVGDLARFDYDFVKIDIQGYENDLLACNLGKMKPCIMEAHTWWTVEKFRQRGFRVVRLGHKELGTSFMVNYP